MKPSTAALSLAALGLAIAGCDVVPPPQSDATRFYVLAASPLASAPATGTLRIGLKNVELAAYLKTRDMIVRSGTNELVLQDYARWAEPLDAGIFRVIRTELSTGPVGRIYAQPFPFDADRDYDVSVTILHCEGETVSFARSVARFSAVIEITTTGANARVAARRVFTAPDAAWNGHDYDRLAGLLSADVQALGREIISALPASP